MDYIGKIISKTQGQPTQASASGVWTLDEAAAAVKNNSWPIPGVPNPISKSLRFNSADTAYLNRTPASVGNRQKFTISFWLKRSVIGATDVLSGAVAGNGFFVSFPSESSGSLSSTLYLYDSGAASGGWQIFSARVFRDVSAWYHIVIALDTTQSTDSNRIKVYINGVQEDIATWQVGSGASRYPSLNANIQWNNTTEHRIGHANNYGYFNGYITELYNVDGQQLAASSFGQTNANTGVWEPKPYTGTYGTNGFYLNFKDSATTTALGYDYSGNGNNWTPNNFSVTAGAGNDSLVDVPTQWIGYNTSGDTGGIWRGNYCTLNPLFKTGAGTPSYANGNLDMTAGGTGDSYFAGTVILSAGKWYYEATITSVGTGGTSILIGVCRVTDSQTTGNLGSYRSTSEIYNLDGTTQTAGATYTTNDVIGVAIDIDNGTVKFYKNNVGQGATNSFTFTAGTPLIVRGRSDGANPTATFNFGQRPFAYTPPAGYLSLCTTNLPTPTIGATSTTQAGKYFNPVLYTGTGSSLGVTGVGFQPDWTWIKSRSAATDHGLYDAVRGVQKQLESNNNGAETTETTGLTAFNTDGFTVGALAQLNTNTATYVAWNWKANGAGSSNNAGSIQSTVSANTTAGFSIVTYTGNATAGATVGHGCLVNNVATAPSMIFFKLYSGASNWIVYHVSVGATKVLVLNTTGAEATSTAFNNTAPSSTVFTLGGTAQGTNDNSMLAYCFAPVAGYSAFGKYTGNGSTDGPFIYTGFRPRYVLIKRSSAAGESWFIHDTARSPYNVSNLFLAANLDWADTTAAQFDILSNGIKIRESGSGTNTNGDTYIYAAFAENPFKYSLAR